MDACGARDQWKWSPMVYLMIADGSHNESAGM
jgi:hypothetical protein